MQSMVMAPDMVEGGGAVNPADGASQGGGPRLAARGAAFRNPANRLRPFPAGAIQPAGCRASFFSASPWM